MTAGGKNKNKSVRPKSADDSKNQLALERLKNARTLRIIDAIYGFARLLVRMLAWTICVYFGYRSIVAIAGTNTTFNAALKGVLDLSLDRYAAYAVAMLASVGYYNERRLRQRTIKGRDEYIKQLERTIDPQRSGSGLSSTGRARKEDLDEH